MFNAIPYLPSSQRHREITDAITYHIAKDMCPIRTVSSEGFKKMITTLDKRYSIPSRNHFFNVALPSLYAKCRKEIEREILSLEYFAAMTDLWSSRTAEPYLRLCKKLVSSFSYSWKRKREFLAAQKEMKLPEHSLKTVSNKVGITSGHDRENHRAAKGHCTCPVL